MRVINRKRASGRGIPALSPRPGNFAIGRVPQPFGPLKEGANSVMLSSTYATSRAPAPPGNPMLLRFAKILSAMSLLSLLGCSPTSKDLPASLAEFRAKINIEDVTDLMVGNNYARTSIRAVLSNARGKDIERSDVKIEVNGIPMQFRVGIGNYYDRHPFYYLDDNSSLAVKPATEYRFVLVLPDGARHEIGTVRTPAALTTKQIDFPRQRPASGAVAIGWRDLAEPAELVLYRSVVRREDERTLVHEGGSINDPAALRRTIGPGWFRSRSDTWTLPEKFLTSEANPILTSIGVEIAVASKGRIAAGFSKESTLSAERRIKLDMECAKVD